MLSYDFVFKTHVSAFCTFNDWIFIKKITPKEKQTTIILVAKLNVFIINGAGHLLRTDMIRPKDKLKYYLLCLGKPRFVEAALAMFSHWHNTHVRHIAKIKVLKTG